MSRFPALAGFATLAASIAFGATLLVAAPVQAGELVAFGAIAPAASAASDDSRLVAFAPIAKRRAVPESDARRAQWEFVILYRTESGNIHANVADTFLTLSDCMARHDTFTRYNDSPRYSADCELFDESDARPGHF